MSDKTWEDYYNDPDTVDEVDPMREIHAIRPRLYDKRQELTETEYNDFIHEESEKALKGLKVKRMTLEEWRRESNQ